jgi:hypothetical protein
MTTDVSSANKIPLLNLTGTLGFWSLNKDQHKFTEEFLKGTGVITCCFSKVTRPEVLSLIPSTEKNNNNNNNNKNTLAKVRRKNRRKSGSKETTTHTSLELCGSSSDQKGT